MSETVVGCERCQVRAASWFIQNPWSGKKLLTLCQNCAIKEGWCAGCQSCEFRGGHRLVREEE
jgi:hypothetical protein